MESRSSKSPADNTEKVSALLQATTTDRRSIKRRFVFFLYSSTLFLIFKLTRRFVLSFFSYLLSLSLNMSSSPYFSLHSILAEEERVPVVWSDYTKGVGYLDPSIGSEDLEMDQELEIPLWLAEALKPNNYIDLKLPRMFGLSVRQSLKADAKSVKLREKSPFFYELGLRMSELVDGEVTKDLPKDILHALAQRIEDVLERAPRGLGKDTNVYKNGLAVLEADLYLSVQLYAAMRQRQRQGLDDKLAPSTEETANKVRAHTRLPLSRNNKRERSILG